jgi:hypothetical protein
MGSDSIDKAPFKVDCLPIPASGLRLSGKLRQSLNALLKPIIAQSPHFIGDLLDLPPITLKLLSLGMCD